MILWSTVLGGLFLALRSVYLAQGYFVNRSLSPARLRTWLENLTWVPVASAVAA